MRRGVFAVLCSLLLSAAAPPPPGFGAYPAGPVFTGANRIVLRARDMDYRTRLREAAAQKPDFAGHYVLASWGCGTECVMGAAIDVRSGRVTWLPGTLCCWYPDAFADASEAEPLRFRLDSRLLILTGARNERNGDLAEHHYLIDGNRFVHLRDVALPGRR